MVEGSTAICGAGQVPSPETAQALLTQYLIDDGYDTSGFPKVIPISEVP